MAKSKKASVLGSKSAHEGPRITLRSSESNVKFKIQDQEHEEHELGTAVAARLQAHERPNPSFKRTRLRRSA